MDADPREDEHGADERRGHQDDERADLVGKKGGNYSPKEGGGVYDGNKVEGEAG